MSSLPAAATLSKPTVAHASASAIQNSTVAHTVPEDYAQLTPESLLYFCQTRLQKMDTAITKKMRDQNGLVALQGMVGDVQSSLKTGGAGGGNDRAFKDQGKVNEVSAKLDAAIATAENAGQPEAAQQLRLVKEKLHAGDDDIVGVDELKEMNQMLDTASSDCRSGAEVSMLELQSMVSQRATVLQLTTGMMNSINESAKSIASNIGRG